MTDFLLELRSEESPARMQADARTDLKKLFRREMEASGIDVPDVTVWSTPRRLALIARGLPDATEAVSEEAKGPPEGAPAPALEGFCRKNGVRMDQLQLREVKGRQTWFALIEKPGRATKEVLADAIPAIVRDFAWPKSMRWGAASLSTESARWVRPLSGIVAILGEELVECEAAGIRSGYSTLGHRFHHAGEITIGGASDYAGKLRACHVIVDHEERAALIREGAAKAAAGAGLTLLEDEGLVIENAGLTEWPVPLLGRFDKAFLDVPPEVIQLTARVNQKYFVCESPSRLREGLGEGLSPLAFETDPPPAPPASGRGGLANAFVCTANIAAPDGGAAIVEGNRKVLAARLSDARFFWEQDRKIPLAEHAKKLERITFHEKLGTMADKVERVAKLARWLVEEGIVGGTGLNPNSVRPEPVEGPPSTSSPAPEEKGGASTSSARTGFELADLAEQAARLCKADLVTEMVGEFPELQGVMGGYYARAEGLDPQVADAIRDHYKPVGQGDEVPTAPVTVAVSLADKLDTILGFAAIDEMPTGSRDPFAIRRAALAVIRLIAENKLRLNLASAVQNLAVELTFHRGRYMLSHLDENDRWQAEAWRDAEHRGQPITVTDDGGVFRLRDDGSKTHFSKQLAQPFIAMHDYHRQILAVMPTVLDFFADRLKVQQREAGVRHDLIDAVFALGGEVDLVRLLARVKALQHYLETAEGADLLAAYKRAANILKKEDWHAKTPLPLAGGAGGGPVRDGSDGPTPDPSRKREGGLDTDGIAKTGEEDPLALVDDPDLAPVVAAQLAQKRANEAASAPESAETDLAAALDAAEPKAAAAIEAEDFAAAMSALASLRAPIDRFFTEVMINDPDRDKRAARLDLLLRFRDAVHRVADFSRIEG